jgi:hypothetical protein
MYSKKIQHLVLGAGAAAAVLAVPTGVAATASAEPIGPNGPAKKPGYCAVVNTDTNGDEMVHLRADREPVRPDVLRKRWRMARRLARR